MKWIKSNESTPKDNFLKYIKVIGENNHYKMVGWYSKDSNLFYDTSSSTTYVPSEYLLWLED